MTLDTIKTEKMNSGAALREILLPMLKKSRDEAISDNDWEAASLLNAAYVHAAVAEKAYNFEARLQDVREVVLGRSPFFTSKAVLADVLDRAEREWLERQVSQDPFARHMNVAYQFRLMELTSQMRDPRQSNTKALAEEQYLIHMLLSTLFQHVEVLARGEGHLAVVLRRRLAYFGHGEQGALMVSRDVHDAVDAWQREQFQKASQA